MALTRSVHRCRTPDDSERGTASVICIFVVVSDDEDKESIQTESSSWFCENDEVVVVVVIVGKDPTKVCLRYRNKVKITFVPIRSLNIGRGD